MGITLSGMSEFTRGWKRAFYYAHGGIFYFRVLGYGLHFKDWRRTYVSFSERGFYSVGRPFW